MNAMNFPSGEMLIPEDPIGIVAFSGNLIVNCIGVWTSDFPLFHGCQISAVRIAPATNAHANQSHPVFRPDSGISGGSSLTAGIVAAERCDGSAAKLRDILDLLDSRLKRFKSFAMSFTAL